ncbi:MAG: hypothetical protein AB7V62_05225 [Thermoleophilia bacterium]
MGEEPDDWRLTNQEQHLLGVEPAWREYRARSPQWEHDHCSFCWAKFMDPTFSEVHRRAIEADPEILTAGYATTDDHPQGAEYHWVCETCFADFAPRFGWRLAS